MSQSALLTLFCAATLLLCCGRTTSEQQESQTVQQEAESTFHPDSITDPRDGETYPIVAIGQQIWMAENARFNSQGSMINPENPSKVYGRLYNLNSIQTACPEGWHLPSDAEWDELEMAHGMPASFVGKGGWRGEHAFNMRSTTGWSPNDGGTDSLHFQVLPAGYYATGQAGLPQGFEALGFGAAFWSATENGTATARFMFEMKGFVNKWEDEDNETGMALSCRCVKNEAIGVLD